MIYGITHCFGREFLFNFRLNNMIVIGALVLIGCGCTDLWGHFQLWTRPDHTIISIIGFTPKHLCTLITIVTNVSICLSVKHPFPVTNLYLLWLWNLSKLRGLLRHATVATTEMAASIHQVYNHRRVHISRKCGFNFNTSSQSGRGLIAQKPFPASGLQFRTSK